MRFCQAPGPQAAPALTWCGFCQHRRSDRDAPLVIRAAMAETGLRGGERGGNKLHATFKQAILAGEIFCSNPIATSAQ